jgi:peptidoglycan/xylan/chitin deacetylase (PgdA/CDA1 family)
MITGLCYHGVYESDVKPFNSSGKHMHVSEFEYQMKILKSKHRVVDMAELESLIETQGYLERDYVFVTFDDGYQNNLTVATDILAELGLPATLFLSTGFIDSAVHIWTDILEDFFMLAPTNLITQFLQLSKPLITLSNLGRVEQFNNVRRFLKSLPIDLRDEILKQVPKNYDLDSQICDEIHSYLNWDQAREMKESGVWTFGSHTVSHNPLTKLDIVSAELEVSESFKRLVDEGVSPGRRYFAYPEGQIGDFSSFTRRILSKCDVDLAFSAQIDPNTNIDSLALDRILVGFEGILFPFV